MTEGPISTTSATDTLVVGYDHNHEATVQLSEQLYPKEKIKIIVGSSIGNAWSYDIEDEWDDELDENVCSDRIRNARLYVLTYQPMIDALERDCSHDEFETVFQQMRKELEEKFDIYFSQFFVKSDIEIREVVVGEFLIQKGLSGNEYLITKEDFHTSNFWRD